MNHPNLDPVAVLVLLSALLFSPHVAAVVGPYLVILLGSSLGAYFRLGQRGVMTRMAAAFFFLAINGVAILLTVPLCITVPKYLPRSIEATWLFGPVAFGIGLVGERWPLVGHWLVRKAGAVIDLIVRGKTGGTYGS